MTARHWCRLIVHRNRGILRSIVTAAFMSAALASLRSTAAAAQGTYLETVKVTADIYVFKPRIDWMHGNGVAIIGTDGVFFIDTYQQSNYADEAIRRLRAITKRPVRYVLNTHWHNDHVMGNGAFRHAFPGAQFIAHDSTPAYLASIIAPALDSEAKALAPAIDHAIKELANRKTDRGVEITGSMVPFWEWSIRDAKAYQREYKKYPPVNPGITFSDTLTMRWGKHTLRLIHVGGNSHSEGDVIVWLPETRLLVSGDIVVAPTPYETNHNSAGMIRAIDQLIAMDPAIIIPGHGPVEYDQTYMRAVRRAFAEYRRAAEEAVAKKVPVREALAITLPDIDKSFIGDDALKTWAYRSFFARNLIYRVYVDSGAVKPTP